MLKTIEKALLLQEIDVLQFASADHLMQLAEAGEEQIYRKGDSIVRAGEPSQTLYLLLHGHAAAEETGGQILQKTALNLCACLTGAPQACSYICLDDCTILGIGTSDLLDLLAGEPELSLALLKYFAAKENHQLSKSDQIP
jgi:CRP-like cAMP-binding protein